MYVSLQILATVLQFKCSCYYYTRL